MPTTLIYVFSISVKISPSPKVFKSLIHRVAFAEYVHFIGKRQDAERENLKGCTLQGNRCTGGSGSGGGRGRACGWN